MPFHHKKRCKMKRLKTNRPLSARLLPFLILCAACLGAGRTSAQTPRLFLDPGGHTSIVRQVLYTPDGRHLISVGNDKSIRVWDTVSGKQISSPIYGQVGDDSQGQLLAAALDPTGKLLAVAGRTYIGPYELDDTKNNFVIRVFHLDDLAARPIAATLQQMLPPKENSEAKGHGDTIRALVFSHNGERLASGSADTSVRLWDLKSGKCTVLGGRGDYSADDPGKADEHTAAVTCLAWSPDDRQIVSGGQDSTVRLWNTASGGQAKDIKKVDFSEKVRCLAWSPASVNKAQTILIGTESDDSNTGSVYTWNVSSGKKERLSGQNKPVSCVAYSRNGRYAALGQDVGSGGECLVRVWPAERIGKEAGQSFSRGGAVQSIAFAPDENALVSGTNDGDIFLWNMTAPAPPVRFGGSGSPATNVAWAADGSKLRWQSGGVSHVYTLDEATCKPEAEGSAWKGDDSVNAGSRRLTVTDDGHAVKSAGVQYPAADAPGYLNDYVTSKFLTRDGKYVVVGSTLYLRMFQASDGRLLHTFVGHTAKVSSVAVSPKGNYLASASDDQTVRIWSLSPEQEDPAKPLLSIFADSQRNFVAWAQHGYYADGGNGQRLIGWERNQGDDARAAFDQAQNFPSLRRNEVIAALWKNDGDITSAAASVGAPSMDIGDLRPPAVSSLNLKDGQLVNTASAKVSATLKPGSSPLGHVLVAVNGHVVKAEDLSDSGGQSLTRTWLVALAKGQSNLISVTVNDKPQSKGLQPSISNTSVSVRCTVPPDAPHPPRLTLLTIGVSRYASFLDLLYPDRDAIEIANEFQAQEGKLFSKVTPISLINKKATKANIESALKTLQETPKDENDYTVVFIAGHGGQTDAKHYYFLPYDVQTWGGSEAEGKQRVAVTAVNWDDIYAALKSLPGHVILFLDTCHSAGATKTQTDAPENDETKNMGYRDFLDKLSTESTNATSSVITFPSCDSGETSQEAVQYKHGAFAEALIEGLRTENNQIPLDTRGDVTLARLSKYVGDRVPVLTNKKQFPPLLNARAEVQELPLAQVTQRREAAKR